MYKQIEYSQSYYSGWPKNVIPLLQISLGIFLHNYNNVKIGITNDPDRRFYEHQKRNPSMNWERMVLKYSTTSVCNANAVEQYFIKNRPELVNSWAGFSNMTEKGPYYVYILLGDHK